MTDELFERELQNTSINDVSLADYIKENYVPKKSGKWIWSVEIDRYVCDKCGQSDGKDKEMIESGEYQLSNYCHNCGAKMVEPQESEEK